MRILIFLMVFASFANVFLAIGFQKVVVDITEVKTILQPHGSVDDILSGHTFYGTLESSAENAQLSAQFTMLNGKNGSATATIAFPGDFTAGVLGLELDEGRSYYVTNYYEGQTFYFAWSASPRASKYLVEIYGYCEIEDEDYNELIDTDISMVLSTTSTSYTLPVSDVFDESVLSYMADPDNDVYCDLYFYFYAINGPYSSGEMGNVSGDAYGFFNGMTSGGTINIEIHEPTISKVGKNSSYEHQKKQPPSRDRSLLKYLLAE